MKGFFGWFKNSSKMKRWMLLILIGVALTSFGMASIINSEEAITVGFAAKTIIFFVIGFTCIILGLVYINKRTMELFVESTDRRLESERKVNVNSLIFNKNIYEQGPNIVVIGGGSGLNTLLEGFKRYTSNITAIVTVSSYGENMTKNDEKMKYLQLEDIKNGIAALSINDNKKMSNLLNYRFNEGPLAGIAFSDVYFEAMNNISRGIANAVKSSNDIYKIYGKVLPVTQDEMKVCAELGNGYVVEEKSRIASMVYDKLTSINRVYLSPSNCKPTQGVIEAISEADSIIIGPGSLYANIIPNLLVNGIAKAIKESRAKKIYVCNIMTEPGLTDNYSVADHINAIVDHCGEGLIDYCVYDTGEVIPEFIKKYNQDGADLVEQNLEKIKDKRIKFIKENLSVISNDCVRHNSMMIADLVIQMICDDLRYQDKQNDPEYMMMSNKLKADKQLNKQKKRKSNKKNNTTNSKHGKSKFASKYSERIESIRNSDNKQKSKKKANNVAKQENQTQEEKVDLLEEIKKAEEKEEQPVVAEIKIKNYEQIRKEMLEKFNGGKTKKK